MKVSKVRDLRRAVPSAPIGQRIRSHRDRLGLTQTQLADALGLTAQQVSKYERDQDDLNVPRLMQLGEIFGIDPRELLPEPRRGFGEGVQTAFGSPRRLRRKVDAGRASMLAALTAIEQHVKELRAQVVSDPGASDADGA